MILRRLRYVQKFKDRHGKLRYYLRRPGCKPIALPDENDPGFDEAYRVAFAKAAPPTKADRFHPRSIEALARSYYASAHFLQLGPTTQPVYRRIIEGLRRKHGHRLATDLAASHVRKMLAEHVETPAAGNHLLRTLRALMQHAIEEQWRHDDPTLGVKRLKEVGEGAATWTEEDIATFEAQWPPGSRPRLALALLLYTGQRRSDVVRMGRQHLKGDAIEVRQVKTKARLLLPLHRELAELIRGETDRLTFLVTQAGAPFTANGFYNHFTAWAREAGLPAGLSPHGLRKAAARRLAEAGCTAHQIAAVTGHKTLAEVQRYTVAAGQADLARAAMDRLQTAQSGNGVVKPPRQTARK